MITKNNEFQFAVGIRQKIIDMLAGIGNATWAQFNDHSPNWLTRAKIKSLIEEYESGLIALGAIPTEVHAPCGHQNHEKLATWKLGGGYWRFVLADGKTDSELVVDGELMIDDHIMESDFDSMVHDQSASHKPCPCDPRKRAKEHSVSRFFIWARDPESKLCELAKLASHFSDALDLSEDRKTRSAIREELLLALIALERLLVPVSVEEETTKRESL